MKPVKKLFLFRSLPFLLVMILTACSTTQRSQSSRPDRGELIFADQSDNAYILRGQRSLIKYNIRNIPVDRYDFDVSVWDLGMSSDLRFYAFNRDFQTFYILDQYLNEISKISFSETLDFMASHPILVQGQLIWLYNPSEHRLEQYNLQLERTASSRNLSRDIPRLRVDQLLFHKNQIFLNDFNQGIFIFDYTGRLLRKIPLPRQTEKAQIDQSSSFLFVFTDREWHILDLHKRILQPDRMDLPEEVDDIRGLIFQNGKIYHWDPEKLSIESFPYSFTSS